MKDKFPWLNVIFQHTEQKGDRFSLLTWLKWVGVCLCVLAAMRLCAWLLL